jgi:hypothetical protein
VMQDQDDSLIGLANNLSELNELWSPHTGQIDVGRALFYEGFKKIFTCAGRNWGKTEFAAYALWRWQAENPGTESYIFEPFAVQAREILWSGNRIQSFGPSDWIESVNNTEMRITFKTGGFIKVCGSDNFEAYRGIKPRGLCIFDEVKDLNPKFFAAFEPNLAAYNPPALYIGTPPEFENHFTDRMKLAKASKSWKYIEAPTSVNPYISKEWLDEKKSELILMGDEETWLREYEAKFVIGGKRSIFPQVTKMSQVSYARPMDMHKMTILVAFDPASTSIFGAVFLLYNPWSRRTSVVDEIYESDPVKMTARAIRDEVKSKLKLYDGTYDIRFCYDEAAAWFRNEMSEIEPDWWLEPSQKARFGVDGYIELLRIVLNKNLLDITFTAPKLWWELLNYQKDEKGKIPKKNDHNINALQYGLAALGLDLELKDEPVFVQKNEDRRGYTLREDFKSDDFEEI